MTHPGHVAATLKDLEAHASKKEMLATPLSAKRLRDFLVAEILAGNGVRQPAGGPRAVVASQVDELNFDLSSDDEDNKAVDLAPPAQRLAGLEEIQPP